MKIRPVGAQLFHVDGQTDRMTKLTVAFRNFVSTPKKLNTDISEMSSLPHMVTHLLRI